MQTVRCSSKECGKCWSNVPWYITEKKVNTIMIILLLKFTHEFYNYVDADKNGIKFVFFMLS